MLSSRTIFGAAMVATLSTQVTAEVSPQDAYCNMKNKNQGFIQTEAGKCVRATTQELCDRLGENYIFNEADKTCLDPANSKSQNEKLCDEHARQDHKGWVYNAADDSCTNPVADAIREAMCRSLEGSGYFWEDGQCKMPSDTDTKLAQANFAWTREQCDQMGEEWIFDEATENCYHEDFSKSQNEKLCDEHARQDHEGWVYNAADDSCTNPVADAIRETMCRSLEGSGYFWEDGQCKMPSDTDTKLAHKRLSHANFQISEGGSEGIEQQDMCSTKEDCVRFDAWDVEPDMNGTKEDCESCDVWDVEPDMNGTKEDCESFGGSWYAVTEMCESFFMMSKKGEALRLKQEAAAEAAREEKAGNGSFYLGFGVGAATMAAAWATYHVSCAKTRKSSELEPLL